MPLDEAFEDGEPNLFSLLRWDYRLVETLYGRTDAVSKILSWAESGSPTPSVRLIAGEGGAGKTRLAATVAQMLADKGWTAGFLDRATDVLDFAVGEKGLFLVLDYPEEQPEHTAAVLREIAENKTAPFPLRVLLLSRRSFAEWEREASALGGRFGRQEIAAPAPLTVEEGERLIAEAAGNLARHMKLPEPALRGARDWLAQSERHRLPLYATAAAIHAVLSPREGFGLAGGELLRQFALRELRRVQKASRVLGLGEEGLERLLALGVLADGLGEGTIADLAGAGVCDGTGTDVVAALAKGPWWKNGRLGRLEPDAPAAAFVDAALFPRRFPNGRAALSGWMLIALRENAATFGNRLGRILYDLQILGRTGGVHVLDARLVEMVGANPARAEAFAAAASSQVPFWAANFAAHVALVLARGAADLEAKATYLNNGATYLSALGRREEALEAAEEAVKLRRDLALARPEASKRRGLPSATATSSSREEAARSEAFTPDLAMSLNNLANRLSDLGRREAALEAAQEAVGLTRDLARARPEAFTSYLATSLNNLATMLSDLGRREEALAAAQEAVNIRRDLVRARPEAFAVELARSLWVLGDLYAEDEQPQLALSTLHEGIERLTPVFVAVPMAFVGIMQGLLQSYLSRCEALGQEPDGALLAPVAEVFQRLNPPQDQS